MFFVTMDHLFEDDRKKDREALEKSERKAEKERKKAEKALKKTQKAILKFYKRGFSIKELADDFEMSLDEIKKIVKD